MLTCYRWNLLLTGDNKNEAEDNDLIEGGGDDDDDDWAEDTTVEAMQRRMQELSAGAKSTCSTTANRQT